MRKITFYLMSLICTLLVGTNAMAQATIGLTQALDATASPKPTVGAFTLTNTDNVTLTHVVGSNITKYVGTQTTRTPYLNNVEYVTTGDCYRKNDKETYVNQNVGYKVEIASGYKMSISNVKAQIMVCDDTYKWYVEITDANGKSLYKSDELTTTKKSTASLDQSLTLEDITGSCNVNLWVQQGGQTKYFCVPYLTIDVTLSADARETKTLTTSVTPEGAGTVTPSGTSDVIVGADAIITATANPGYRFVNWTIDGTATETANPYTFANYQAEHTAVANFKQLPVISFAKPEGVTCVNRHFPANIITYDAGESFTLPVNYMYYKEGYTMTGWTDGTNTYAPGGTYTVSADATLVPVFTANTKSLATKKDAATVTYNFVRTGAYTDLYANIENNADVLITQVTVDGETIDVAMPVDCTSGAGVSGKNGKVNNVADGARAQVNEGSVFTIENVVAGTTISFSAVNSIAAADISFNGETTGVVSDKTITHTATAAGDVKAIALKSNYLYSIVINYPEKQTKATTPTITVGDFSFQHKCNPVTVSCAEGETLYVSIDNLPFEKQDDTSLTVDYMIADIQAYATAEGLEQSETAYQEMPSLPYLDWHPYIAWVYQADYNKTYNFDNDKIVKALVDDMDFNVVPVAYANKDVAPSEDLKYADLIVCAEAMSGGATLSNGMQQFVGVKPMINLKGFNYTYNETASKNRWGWGAPANPGKDKVAITPSNLGLKVLEGVTFSTKGTVALYENGGDYNHVQCVNFNESVPAVNSILGTVDGSADKAAMHYIKEKNFFGLFLSVDDFTAYSDNTPIIVGNAAKMLLNGDDLTDAWESAKISAGGYTTFCPIASGAKIKGFEAYTAKLDAANSRVVLIKVPEEDGLEQGKGYIIKGEPKQICVFQTDDDAYMTTTDNDLIGLTADTELGASEVYALGVADGKCFFGPWGGGFMPAGKAYLEVPGAGAAAKLEIVIDDEASAIAAVAAKAEKANGGKAYNLAGQTVSDSFRGIVIRDGKKVIK